MYFPALYSTPGEVENHWIMVAQRKGFLRDGIVSMELLETGERRAARVDHGRWLVDCPCGGAAAAWPESERAACLDCGCIWLAKFPSKRAREAAEAALLERPLGENRNWRPGEESLAALRLENEAARSVGMLV